MLVVTSGRADASPLGNVIRELEKRCKVEIANIEGHVIGIHFNKNAIDIGVVLGDRFESMCAAVELAYQGIPIAHIHGGETTLGSTDNLYRHAISKLAQIHFVANSDFGGVLTKMGEHAHSIYTTGAPGLDALKPIIERGPRVPQKHIVATYHPSLGNQTEVMELITALARFPEYIIYWTAPNNDPGHEVIEAAIELAGINIVEFTHDDYLWCCRQAYCVVGNSSSGIIEMASLGVPVVNIGDRQKGRKQNFGTVNARPIADEIVEKIKFCGGYDEFDDNIYGRPGGISRRIAEIIVGHDMNFGEKLW